MRHTALLPLALLLLACDAGMGTTTTPKGPRLSDDFFTQFAHVVTLAGTPEGADPKVLGPRVLLVGDSQVAAFVGPLVQAASLRDAPWQLTPVSASGSGVQNTQFWPPHLRTRLAAVEPQLVVVNLGTNDANSPSFGEVWLELPRMAAGLLAEVPPGVAVLVVGVPPDLRPFGVPTPSQAQWLDWCWRAALEERAAAEPGFVYAQVAVPPGLVGEDGVHYSQAGGATVAAMVYAAGRELLGETGE